jgi:hypothetical protein
MPDPTTRENQAPPESPHNPAVARIGLRRLDLVLITLLTISLLAHVLTFAGILAARTLLRNQITQLADGVQQAKSTTVRYNFPIDQQLPINMNVPLQRTFTVPIQTNIRINQTIRVPIDTGFGVANLPIPIDATIPISLTVPIEIKQTLPISATVPIHLSVPLQIELGSPAFASYFDQIYRALIDLREQL